MANEVYSKSYWGVGAITNSIGWGIIYKNLVGLISEILSSLKDRSVYYENEENTKALLLEIEQCKILDKASILITPTSYEDGILNAALPIKRLGDELISNNINFPNTNGWQSARNNGILSVTDNAIRVTFADDGSTIGTSFQFSTVIGRKYIFSIKAIKEYVNSSIILRIANESVLGSYLYQEINNSNIIDLNDIEFVATANNTFIGILGTNASSSSFVQVESVSVKEVISADLNLVRGSLASRTNSVGDIDNVDMLGVELIQYQNDFGNGFYWNKSGDTDVSLSNILSPNGVDFAFKITGSNSALTRSYNSGQRLTDSRSIYARTVNGEGTLHLLSFNANSDNLFTITEEWRKFDVTSYQSTGSENFYAVDFRGSSTLTEVLLWEASAKEVIDDTNIPRIDYTGGKGHILLEGQATNLIEYSEDFSNAYWTKSNVSALSGFISPEGVNNAYKLTENTSNGEHRAYQGNTVVTSGLKYTDSFYIKANGRSKIRLSYFGFNLFEPKFDFVNNILISSTGGTSPDIKSVNVGNDWYRVSVTDETNQTQLRGIISFMKDDGSFIYTGNGASGCYIWGAQLEQGELSTYIPTSGGIATRLEETLSRGGLGDFIDSQEGVLYFDGSALANESSSKRISLSDGTSAKRVLIFIQNSTLYVNVNTPSSQSLMSYALADITVFFKMAFKFKENDFALWVNGNKVATDNSGVTFTSNTLTDLRLDGGIGGNPFYGRFKTLAIFTALTDTELQCLTTQS